MVSASVGNRPFPRGALLGAAALVGFALLSATTARLTGVGTTQMPAAAAAESRELRFEDRADGSVAVYEAPEDRLVDILDPGTNGFVRGALRGLARERKRNEIGRQPPFRLVLWVDGRLSLEDPSTGRQIDLEAFGPTNREAFARLLTVGDAAR
jgi:putative photosynthetic complex assembly protein